MSPPVIAATGLVKRFGDHTAVDGIDLHVDAGQVLGVLGPNGAGKSTTVRMLTTMTRPDAGTATVAGLDVVADPVAVRRQIGVTGQDASLDELLTGRQNLHLIGRLARVGSKADVVARATRLLDEFTLTDAADRPVKTYSGGMRRRLDLAASLVTRPPVLFLDEPTTGLDPVSRQRMWEVIGRLVEDGTTVLLTTQYLEEADVLADDIVVIDHGRVIARGTADELKRHLGGEQLKVTLTRADPAAVAALGALGTGPIETLDDGRVLVLAGADRPGLTTEVVRLLDAAAITVDRLETERPSLDDVFFHLTGSPAEPTDVLEGSPA
jgi:daunorubicin resistance ABC transporter ATP-binding subunit